MGGSDSCMCLLPDGRNVELCSHGGSNAFLELQTPGHRFHFLRAIIAHCDSLRKRSRRAGGERLTALQKQDLTLKYFHLDSVARYGSPGLFRAKISRGDVAFWLDHVTSEVKVMTDDTRWKRTGCLEQHDAFVLGPCVPFFTHDAPAELAFERGFFRVLAEFAAAAKAPLLPCTDVAETICLITTNVFISAIFKKINPWSPEKTLKELEATGMLAQFIRCSTIPLAHDAYDFPRGTKKLYDELINCRDFVKKRFKLGEPCGDLVDAILNGRDGSKKRRPIVINKLLAIASQVDITYPPDLLQLSPSTPMSNFIQTTGWFPLLLAIIMGMSVVYWPW